MPLLLLQIIQFAPQAIQAGETIAQFIGRLRDHFQQTGEWDDAHEAAFLAMLDAASSAPEWQTRADAKP
jgi:hypothetical protein